MWTTRVLALAAILLCAHCGLDRHGLEPLDGSRGDGLDATPDVGLDGFADAGPADGEHETGAIDAGSDSEQAGIDAPTDAPAEDGAADGPVDAPIETGPTCSGAVVGGYCWYASPANQSCDTACASNGGCDVAGTVDYAGSGGTDANCVAVLATLGFGNYPHQNWSNNDLGCQFAWSSWTYWSTAIPTTCGAAATGAANAQRMCACNQ